MARLLEKDSKHAQLRSGIWGLGSVSYEVNQLKPKTKETNDSELRNLNSTEKRTLRPNKRFLKNLISNDIGYQRALEKHKNDWRKNHYKLKKSARNQNSVELKEKKGCDTDIVESFGSHIDETVPNLSCLKADTQKPKASNGREIKGRGTSGRRRMENYFD